MSQFEQNELDLFEQRLHGDRWCPTHRYTRKEHQFACLYCVVDAITSLIKIGEGPGHSPWETLRAFGYAEDEIEKAFERSGHTKSGYDLLWKTIQEKLDTCNLKQSGTK